jgi:hypothetical protein
MSFAYYFANKSSLYAIYCVFSIIAGVALLIYWSTVTYNWQCTKCDNIKELSFIGNIFGINIGVNEKYLHCSSCNEKTLFKGIIKK